MIYKSACVRYEYNENSRISGLMCQSRAHIYKLLMCEYFIRLYTYVVPAITSSTVFALVKADKTMMKMVVARMTIANLALKWSR